MLFNEPKLLKSLQYQPHIVRQRRVSVLFNEPKLLKCGTTGGRGIPTQRSFSALQRAEIAEMRGAELAEHPARRVSVLFNEPKLLKLVTAPAHIRLTASFSALQRAEIAEMPMQFVATAVAGEFQCSSTSRNC